MKAIKANKIYSITETSKESYLAQGFDIADDKGKVVERGTHDELMSKGGTYADLVSNE